DATESFLWTTSNLEVALVNEEGIVTAVAPGTTQLTATGAISGAVGQAAVEVIEAVEHQVTVSPTSADMEVGESLTFLAASTRADDPIAWSTSNEATAT